MDAALITLAVISVSLNALAQVSLKKAMMAVGPVPAIAGEIPNFFLSIGLNPWFIAGMSCYALSIGLWLLVLAKAEVSLAYPLLSIGYIITAVIGYYYLGESMSPTKLTGIGLICFGIIILSKKG
jgi:multidrug transporter EmrE-like cation transporter